MLRHVASNWNTKRLAASPMKASLKESDFGFLVVDSASSCSFCSVGECVCLISVTFSLLSTSKFSSSLGLSGIAETSVIGTEVASEWVIVLPGQIDYGASTQGERQEIFEVD